ncbi:hypothetical protein EXIGLDRAFT_300609 [Exidia glandulosa HHB12029]|uniref:EthD domain-containing protein n=1 Tax=Exidia glandulosa HHB12029 TaxID=1314781 RepID=A0A165D8Y0_EXIGL|nr:hypothetical protein EXIGLDRAFT_300609 [Exidia glandulosa HHB12029]
MSTPVPSPNPGGLFIFVELGAETTEAEFHDINEKEHDPPRMALPEFVGATRYRAIDGQKPTWLNLVSISDLSVIGSPPIVAIMEQRSEREAKMSKAFSGLERRVCSLVYDSLSDPSAPKVEAKPGVAVIVGLNTSDPDGLDKWYNEEHLALIRNVPGWVRTRRYKFVDGGLVGFMEGKVIPTFTTVSEFTSEDVLASEELKKAGSTEWRDKVMKDVTFIERRAFKAYKVLA